MTMKTCLNWQGLRCDVCYRVCPLVDKAITLERVHNDRTGIHAKLIPTVHSDACTGCGKCEQACVLEEAAIKVLPMDLAKGLLGRHYRLGWIRHIIHCCTIRCCHLLVRLNLHRLINRLM